MSTRPRRPLPRSSLLSMAIAGLLVAPVGRGATISVNSAMDDGTGGCTLREAIVSIHAGSAQDGCTAVGPPFGVNDTIGFTVTGAIRLNGSQLSITKSVIIDGPGADWLAVDGDATSRVLDISGSGTSVSIDGLTIQSGQAIDYGGGLRVTVGATLALLNITLSGNSALNGGGIDAYRSTVTLTNSTVSGNSAFGGGGIGAFGSTLTLTNSTLSDNSANAGGGIGLAAGFSADDRSTVTLTNSTVSGNSAANLGGGILAQNSTVTLTNSTVSGNSTVNGGGGIDAYRSTVTLTNSTVSGNSAVNGGGIDARNESTVTLTNSILANSTNGDCRFSLNSTVTGSYNLVENTGVYACGLIDGDDGNIIGRDPALDPLADNGCMTRAGNPTGPAALYACVQTHALGTSSPALDEASATFAPATDQRGVSRPQGAADDIGAFELEWSGPDPDPVPAISPWGLLGSIGLMGLLGTWRAGRQARRRTRPDHQ